MGLCRDNPDFPIARPRPKDLATPASRAALTPRKRLEARERHPGERPRARSGGRGLTGAPLDENGCLGGVALRRLRRRRGSQILKRLELNV
jgi:hypothetical protein